MSKFYVGQRVRIVGADISKALIGTETTIVELSVKGRSIGTETFIGHRTSAINVYGVRFVGKDHQLEPITDSYDVVSWESCAWKPEHLRTPA